jgi:hypothetical protein
MKRIILIIFMLLIAVLLTEAGDFKVKENSSVEKNLAFEGGKKYQSLVLDNIFGNIIVEGYNGKIVKLTAEKTIHAKSKEKLENAKKEVKLKITTDGNAMSIIVDGPFRQEDGRVNWCRDLGYTVKYDFQLKVPHKTALTLRTVNDGDVKVSNVQGDFDIHNVNGLLQIDKIAGSGTAHTVNGKVQVDFVKNPKSDCSFHTINGKVDVRFRPGLSADFKLKTFNGEIYSDFPATYLPSNPGKGKREGGKYVYKSSRFQGIRIGKGGPKIKMDTLNGNIYITKGE